MMRMFVVALSLVVVATAVFAQTGLRPGRWETTMQMEMAGIPAQMPAMKSSRCITPDEAKDPASAVPQGPQGRGGQSDCKVSDSKISGSTVTWKMACPSQGMTGTGEMTFTDESYMGTMKMNMAQGAMTMKMEGKRLGDCTK